MIWTNSFTNLDQPNVPAASNPSGNRSKATIAPNIPQGISGLAGMMANSVGNGNMESDAGNSNSSYYYQQQQQVSQQRNRSGSLDGDVGYPIDDADGNGDMPSGGANNSGRGNGGLIDSNYSIKMMANPGNQLRMMQSESAGFHGTMIPPESMAAMASMYRPGSDHSSAAQQAAQAQHNRKLKHMNHQLEQQDSSTNSGKRDSNKAGGMHSYPKNGDKGVVANIPIVSAPEVVSKAQKQSGAKQNEANMPKNASVDDFWMLVNMGDLPQPEQDVLSHNMWGPSRSGNSNAASSKNNNTTSQVSSQKQVEGAQVRVKEGARSNNDASAKSHSHFPQKQAALTVQTQQHSVKRELSSSNGYVDSSKSSDFGGGSSNGLEANDDDAKSTAKSLPSSASSEHLSKKLKIEPAAT
mmetsp:Transcript_92821/g.262136  ORF Transcript_92821/g.262136 Transcript_92821/m.262136 type:complete len:410 (+) Transcript_92821:17-1246(+)